MALMLLGRFGMEPLLTLAAVGLIKLWLFELTRGCNSLLFVAVLSVDVSRFPMTDCWPMLLPLLLLREEIGRPLMTFGILDTIYKLISRKDLYKYSPILKKTYWSFWSLFSLLCDDYSYYLRSICLSPNSRRRFCLSLIDLVITMFANFAYY